MFIVDDAPARVPISADELDLTSLTLIQALPAGWHRPEGGEEVLARLRGAHLIQVGSPAEDGIEGGGLVIDYVIAGGGTPQRLVLGFNELGMWVEAESQLGSTPIPA